MENSQDFYLKQAGMAVQRKEALQENSLNAVTIQYISLCSTFV